MGCVVRGARYGPLGNVGGILLGPIYAANTSLL